MVGFTHFDFILRNARGQRAVGFLAPDYSAGEEMLVARPGIAHIRNLVGKKIGLSKGTYLEYIWVVAAQRARINPNSVQIVDVLPENAGALLLQGKVDAILSWDPYTTQALNAVKGINLFDTSQVSGLAWLVLAARPAFLEKRAAETQTVLRVWQRTTQFIKENPDAAYVIVAEVNHKTLAEVREFAAKDRVLDVAGNRTAFSYAAGFDSLHGATRKMMDFMVQHKLLGQRLDTAELYEEKYLRGLGGE